MGPEDLFHCGKKVPRVITGVKTIRGMEIPVDGKWLYSRIIR